MYLIDEQIKDLIGTELDEKYSLVSAKDIGLDERAGMVYISQEGIGIVVHNIYKKSLEYYGGFQYIDECDKLNLGNYTFYSVDSNTVWICINHWNPGLAERVY